MARGATVDDTGTVVDEGDGGPEHQQSWQDALAQRNQMQMQYPVDPSNGLHYDIQNGKKLYFEPIMTPEQYLQWSKENGEGILHNAGEWNQETGKYESSTDWLKVATLILGGADAAATGAAFAGAGAGGGAAPTAAGVAGEAGAAPALGGGATLAADLAGAGALPTAAAATVPALGGGATLAGNLGGAGALDGAGSVLPSTGLVTSTALPSGGGSSLMNAGGSATALAGAGGTKSVLSKVADILGASGKAVGAATDQAAQNRIAQNDPYISRAKLDDDERQQALRNMAMSDYALNPSNSPYDPNPVAAASGDYGDVLRSQSAQNKARLTAPPKYTAENLPSLEPSTLEKAGDWLSPTLSILAKIAPYL